MKKRARLITAVLAAGILAGMTPAAHAAGFEVQTSDIISVLSNCAPYLAFFAVALIAAIAVCVLAGKFEAKKKKLIRGEALAAILLAFVVTVNLLSIFPLSTLLDVVANPAEEISEESRAEAEALITDIAGEGAVLVKNDGLLPLSAETKALNVFGWASTNPCYGGTGSGAVDTSNCVTLLDGIENGGYALNQTLADLYVSYADVRPAATMSAVDWTLPEPTTDYYTDEIMSEARAFSDVAVIVIARVGGEGTDLPTDFGAVNPDGTPMYTYVDNSDAYPDFTAGQHYLELSQTEKNLVELVCDNFDDVVVIYNSANAMELGWIDDYAQIKSVICCPGAGETGFNALGKMLNGEVNPSGKLSDTYVYDLTSTAAFKNFGDFTYENMNEFGWLESNPFSGEEKLNDVNFVNYTEGIYVGYRFYETAYAEAQAGHMTYDYDSVVQYPFGYGLSYTTFEQKITSFTPAEDGFDISVEVTNTGNAAGKDVVELYVTPPYTNHGIEKSAVNLLDFGKSKALEPGASEIIDFHVNREELASFDDQGYGCYVLESGDYIISARSDAHTVLDEMTYTVTETVVYDTSNPRSSDQTAATAQFDFARGDNVIYLSRADGFANYDEATAAPTNFTMSEVRKANYQNVSNYDLSSYDEGQVEMPVTGANNGVKLKDLRGKDYDDSLWDELLDELSVQDMVDLIAGGGYQTKAITSIGKVGTTDNDGPATIYNNYTGSTGSAYTSGVMLANTWSKDLAFKMGSSIGREADELDVSGWYAPAMNIHRTAFGGRNFEYYSEDGVLSGKIAAEEVKGANQYGVYGYMKHFAFNDQETNRIYQLCTWINEQAIREIYLKPFEITVKEGNIGAVMDGHNYIGDKWTGSSVELNTTVLRDEWGFNGLVSTDMFAGYGYYDADVAIRAGVSSMLNPMNAPDATVTDTESAASVAAMREACHHTLYTVVNSRAYQDGSSFDMVLWQKILIAFDVAVVIILAAVEFVLIRKYKKQALSA